MPDRCDVCDRLWAELAAANDSLLTLVQRKYEYKELAGPHLEAQMYRAIEERQRLKQAILSHQCGDPGTKKAAGAAGPAT